MPGERRPIPNTLYARRLAVRALGLVLQHYQLGDATVKLNPDDPRQAFPGAYDGEVRLYLDGWDVGQKPVAIVDLDLEGARAHVAIPRVRDLVRSNHRRVFREEDVGVFIAPGEPDIDMEVDLQSLIDEHGERMRSAPPRVEPRPHRAVMWRKGREPR